VAVVRSSRCSCRLHSLLASGSQYQAMPISGLPSWLFAVHWM